MHATWLVAGPQHLNTLHYQPSFDTVPSMHIGTSVAARVVRNSYSGPLFLEDGECANATIRRFGSLAGYRWEYIRAISGTRQSAQHPVPQLVLVILTVGVAVESRQEKGGPTNPIPHFLTPHHAS
eukprot:567351-Rhodomonas_salina.1